MSTQPQAQPTDELLRRMIDTHDNLCIKLSSLERTLARFRQHDERLLWTTRVPLDSTGYSQVDLPFQAHYVCVISQASVTVYLAPGALTVQPPEALPVPANDTAVYTLQRTQTVTLFWTGNVGATDAVILQVSDMPIQVGVFKP